MQHQQQSQLQTSQGQQLLGIQQDICSNKYADVTHEKPQASTDVDDKQCLSHELLSAALHHNSQASSHLHAQHAPPSAGTVRAQRSLRPATSCAGSHAAQAG
jgi:hypothetical protein